MMGSYGLVAPWTEGVSLGSGVSSGEGVWSVLGIGAVEDVAWAEVDSEYGGGTSGTSLRMSCPSSWAIAPSPIPNLPLKRSGLIHPCCMGVAES